MVNRPQRSVKRADDSANDLLGREHQYAALDFGEFSSVARRAAVNSLPLSRLRGGLPCLNHRTIATTGRRFQSRVRFEHLIAKRQIGEMSADEYEAKHKIAMHAGNRKQIRLPPVASRLPSIPNSTSLGALHGSDPD